MDVWRRGLCAMHAVHQKCHASRRPPDVILRRSFTRPSTALGDRRPGNEANFSSIVLRLLHPFPQPHPSPPLPSPPLPSPQPPIFCGRDHLLSPKPVFFCLFVCLFVCLFLQWGSQGTVLSIFVKRCIFEGKKIYQDPAVIRTSECQSAALTS